MALNFNTAFGFHERALNVESQRMQILASNLANSDTPNYKAKDINFQEAMAAAAQVTEAGSMSQTAAGHLSGLPASSPAGVVQYRLPTQPALDGNTVDAQQEEAAFSRNAMTYQASLTFITNSIKNLMTAIQDN